MINTIYLVSGILLPLFYLPQIKRIYLDQSRLESFSCSKAVLQFLLRLPALLFAIFEVGSPIMTFVLSLDLAGRAAEVVVAFIALKRQGLTNSEIAIHLSPFAGLSSSRYQPPFSESVLAPAPSQLNESPSQVN